LVTINLLDIATIGTGIDSEVNPLRIGFKIFYPEVMPTASRTALPVNLPRTAFVFIIAIEISE
jgi:hypothetical protein